MVTNPDIKGRREILILYLAKIKHDDSVNLEKLAKMTVGMLCKYFLYLYKRDLEYEKQL